MVAQLGSRAGGREEERGRVKGDDIRSELSAVRQGVKVGLIRNKDEAHVERRVWWGGGEGKAK